MRVQHGIKGIFLGALMGFACSITAFAHEAVYPQTFVHNDPRGLYAKAVIELALSKTQDEFGPAAFQFSKRPMERKRMEIEVERGINANVIMLPGNNGYDARFILVPIPIDKGLLGVRIGFVNRAMPDVLKGIASLADLKRLKACLGTNWNITEIFEFNQLPVQKSYKYEDLFHLIDKQRCDYFSRGVNEVFAEYNEMSGKYPNILIDRNLILRTPIAFYLYVSKLYPALAERLHRGLEMAYVDGSFDALFLEKMGDVIDKIRLQERTVVTLDSPIRHDAAPVANKRYWLNVLAD